MAEHDVDIDRLFEPDAEGALKAYLHLLDAVDISALFDFVDEEDWPRITTHLSPETLGDVLANLDEGQRAVLGEVLRPERLVAAVEELESDDAADVLGDLPDETSTVVLQELEDREEIEALLAYPEDSAGGIMQTELCRVREDATVADATEEVRATREEVEDVLEVYVVDAEGRLTGVVDLEDLVLSKASTPIHAIRQPVEQKVTPDLDQEEVAQIFGKYDLTTLPVVNTEGVLLGRITFDDVHDVLEEEASEDLMASVGSSPEELVYSGRVLSVALHRLPWLASSLAGSIMTGYLLSLFGRFPTDAIIMASFVPVVMAMTGNVGSQSAMIVTRGLAIGRVEVSTISRSLWREVSVGLIMGSSAGVVVGVLGFLWQGQLTLGIAVAASMSASMTMASLLGAAAPAIFKRMGIDPAIASGPLVTTGCDLMGVSVYLGVALLVLR